MNRAHSKRFAKSDEVPVPEFELSRRPCRRRADPGCAGGYAEARAVLWRAAEVGGPI